MIKIRLETRNKTESIRKVLHSLDLPVGINTEGHKVDSLRSLVLSTARKELDKKVRTYMEGDYLVLAEDTGASWIVEEEV